MSDFEVKNERMRILDSGLACTQMPSLFVFSCTSLLWENSTCKALDMFTCLQDQMFSALFRVTSRYNNVSLVCILNLGVKDGSTVGMPLLNQLIQQKGRRSQRINTSGQESVFFQQAFYRTSVGFGGGAVPVVYIRTNKIRNRISKFRRQISKLPRKISELRKFMLRNKTQLSCKINYAVDDDMNAQELKLGYQWPQVLCVVMLVITPTTAKIDHRPGPCYLHRLR
jgi:hypothetical protein